jgi:hypothetical protein
MDELKNMSREDLLLGIASLRSEVCQREEHRQVMAMEITHLRRVEQAARELLRQHLALHPDSHLYMIIDEIQALSAALSAPPAPSSAAAPVTMKCEYCEKEAVHLGLCADHDDQGYYKLSQSSAATKEEK